MTNSLYPTFHEKNLSEFNRLLQEADEFDETQANDDTIKEDPNKKKDPAQMQEDDVFSKVKQENEQDTDTNAYAFLARQEDGSLGAINNLTNQKDPAIKGLCMVISGDILQNSDNAVGYITALFNNVGVNDIQAEDFEKIKGSIWKKLEELTPLEPTIAYSTFQKFIINLVNGVRENRDLNGAA
jgi:hypothetical protein